jgi:hypothetical protein
MKNEEVVNQVISAIETKNWEHVEKHLTDDFSFSGTVAQPINKKQWVDFQRAIHTGLPDMKYNADKPTLKSDNKVSVKVKLTGTHTADMPAPLPGHKGIPVTGKKVQLPLEELEFTLKDDKISSLYVKPVPHGGVNGIVEQLEGVKMTQAEKK